MRRTPPILAAAVAPRPLAHGPAEGSADGAPPRWTGELAPGEGSFAEASIEDLIRRRVAILLERLGNGPIADLYDLVVREVERGLLSLILERCGGNRGRAAEQLGLHRNTLRQKLTRLGLDRPAKLRPAAAPKRRSR